MNLITLTGPSCSGKTTLLNELVDNHGFASVVSHTTRPMRPGEIDGRDYLFIDQKSFDAMVDLGMFIENISFNGYSYGVSASEIAHVESQGKTAVLIVEPKGLEQITAYSKKHAINLYPIYLNGHAPNLVARYIGRLHGENLVDKDVSARHAKRLLSLLDEVNFWAPDENRNFGSIKYEIYVSELNNKNFNTFIEVIKESYDRWLKSKQ